MLELILGPMYSGKTTALLSRRLGKTLIVNHVFDTRCEGVKTHDGLHENALKCEVIPRLSGYDTYLIDEAQFFDNLDEVDTLAPNVVVAGLSGDYLKRPFGNILNIIPKADKVTFLTAECVCGAPAPFTKRIDCSTELVKVDATYIPVCGQCY